MSQRVRKDLESFPRRDGPLLSGVEAAGLLLGRNPGRLPGARTGGGDAALQVSARRAGRGRISLGLRARRNPHFLSSASSFFTRSDTCIPTPPHFPYIFWEVTVHLKSVFLTLYLMPEAVLLWKLRGSAVAFSTTCELVNLSFSQ